MLRRIHFDPSSSVPVATLLFRAVLLLHGHQGREVGLVVGQHQGRAVALAGWDLQGQINPSKWNRCKG